MDKETSQKTVSRGFCELKDVIQKVICVGPLTDHHIKKRSNLDSRHDKENQICVCLSHHSWIHHHPNEARKLGLIIDSKSNLL